MLQYTPLNSPYPPYPPISPPYPPILPPKIYSPPSPPPFPPSPDYWERYLSYSWMSTIALGIFIICITVLVITYKLIKKRRNVQNQSEINEIPMVTVVIHPSENETSIANPT
tara:strand:- start:168 stop:503 length:336 start_codon:yes stop_codon:yes gene_type:complete